MESQSFPTPLTPVNPVRPVAPYVGGKRALARRIVGMINDHPDTRAIFGRFKFEPVDLFYRLSGGPTATRELIVSN